VGAYWPGQQSEEALELAASETFDTGVLSLTYQPKGAA
jgi:hypothetical protein